MARPRFEGGGYKAVYFPRWRYIQGETLMMDGTSQAATIPAGATIVEIRAETSDVYFRLNHSIANATSPGFVPQNGAEILGPLDNLSALTLWGAAANAAVAHIMYFQER